LKIKKKKKIQVAFWKQKKKKRLATSGFRLHNNTQYFKVVEIINELAVLIAI